MPRRILTVTGTGRPSEPDASTAARTMAASRRGRTGTADAAAVAGDLADRAAEVQVDVVDAGLGDQPLDRSGHRGRIGAVELDRPGRLVGVEGGQLPALGATLGQAASVDHLADVEPGPEPAAQAPEGGVGDARHRRQHHRRPHLERTDLHPARLRRPRRASVSGATLRERSSISLIRSHVQRTEAGNRVHAREKDRYPLGPWPGSATCWRRVPPRRSSSSRRRPTTPPASSRRRSASCSRWRRRSCR